MKLKVNEFIAGMENRKFEGRRDVYFCQDMALGRFRLHKNITHKQMMSYAAEYAVEGTYCKEIRVEGIHNFYPEQIKEEERKVIKCESKTDDPWDFPDEAEDED